jgi:5-methylcytosine-specific restriction endonuclease McrA
MHDTLLLNADFAPLGIVAWQRAIGLVLADKARPVEAWPERSVRAPTTALDWPAVVHLVRQVRPRRPLGPSRRHVLARDGFTCQYCGLRPVRPSGRPEIQALTIDHVVPRAHAVEGQVRLEDGRRVPVGAWENVVAACAPCNQQKADRTPAEAGLSLRRTPRAPSVRETVPLSLARQRLPDVWAPFLGGPAA